MTKVQKLIANPHSRPKKRKAKKNGLLVSVGRAAALNPQKGKSVNNSEKKNPTKTSKNALVKVYAVEKKRNGRSSSDTSRSSRNPNFTVLGQAMKPMDILKLIGGVLIGVAGVKFATPMLPPSLTSNIGAKTVSSGVVAVVLGKGAETIDPVFGSGVLIGGGAQTVSMGLNAFLPDIGSRIALSGVRPGMGRLVQVNRPVPNNPFAAPIQIAAAASTPAAGAAVRRGVAAVYPNPYGRRLAA